MPRERPPGSRRGRAGWYGPPWGSGGTTVTPPPWWPEGEPWPPRRRHRRWGFGCLFAAVGITLIVGVVSIVTTLVAGLRPHGEARPLETVFAFLVAGLVLVGLGRLIGAGLWRTGRTLDELVDAARRVEAGDYSVRVAPGRSGPRGAGDLARAFNTMVSRLEVEDRERRTLLADVSHELRTPLAVIRGRVEAIIDGVHPADEAHLSAIVDETRVMERLVEDLRTLSLAESGTLSLHREGVDPDELVRDVAASFGPAAAEAGIALRVDAPEDLPEAELDPVRMREVIGNLVDNALRHTPRGGQVTVRVRGGAALRLEVTDTGPGIEPSVLPHVFERFVKGQGSRGSGLGLAIARSLVAAHGGTIEVESQAGAGTTFTVIIPTGGEAAPRS